MLCCISPFVKLVIFWYKTVCEQYHINSCKNLCRKYKKDQFSNCFLSLKIKCPTQISNLERTLMFSSDCFRHSFLSKSKGYSHSALVILFGSDFKSRGELENWNNGALNSIDRFIGVGSLRSSILFQIQFSMFGRFCSARFGWGTKVYVQNQSGPSNGILHRFCLTRESTLTSQDYSPSSMVYVSKPTKAIWRYLPSS